jgi:modulator of FtsH protease
MDPRWTDFYVTSGGAAAALTGLLFVAVALRPREIRGSALMVGRARSAFYAFATVLLVALLALAGTRSRLIGLGQLTVAAGALALSLPFTITAWRTRTLNVRRATVYHLGLVLVAVAGVIRSIQGIRQHDEVLLAVGILLLLAIALSNSWQLVLSHEPDGGAGPTA